LPPDRAAGGSARRAVAAFGLTSFFSDLAHEAVTSVLPLIVLTLGGAPALALGVIEGVSDAASALCKLAGGRLADRLRRLKPATVGGYLVTGIAVPAIGLATSWWQVLGLRTLGWCGRGLRNPMRDTLLVRSIPAEVRGRAFGIERAMDQCGAVLAPLVVILLLRSHLTVDGIVLWSLVPGLLAALAMAVLVREPRRDSQPVHDASGLVALAALPSSFRRLLVALLVFGSGDFAKTLLVFWAVGESVEIASVATYTRPILLYAGFNAVTVVAALAGGHLSDRLGRRPVLLAGYACGVASALVPVALPASTASAILALGLAGLQVGIEDSVERAWAADLAPEGKRGRAFGWVHAVNGVGDLVASALVGGLWALAGPRFAFGAAAALMAAGVLLMARFRPVAADRRP
jgi:MFS family permease